MQFSIWLPIISLVLGGILHSLTDDGGSNLLTHFGITWKAPTIVLPATILLLTIASGWSTAVQAGTPWQQALAASVATALSGLFGAVAVHATTNKTPPKDPPGAGAGAALFLLMCAALGGLSACNSGQQAIDNSCVAIHAADEACELVDVPGPDGGVIQVELRAKDLRALATQKALAGDGGAR